MRCPICKKPAPPRDENAAFPLCSERCRLIDLGNWLGEAYRVPDTHEDQEPASDSGPGENEH
jgi:endogenous inhibitor of DNA gyrase (YacG/DUF329 family)